jgi:predicted aconitase
VRVLTLKVVHLHWRLDLTGRTPRYGLHLDQKRRATRRFQMKTQPAELTDWGVLGAVIGRMAGSYWEVPVIEGIETRADL